MQGALLAVAVLKLLSNRPLLLSFPYNPAERSLARVQYARPRRRLDEQLVAFDSKMPPLLGTHSSSFHETSTRIMRSPPSTRYLPLYASIDLCTAARSESLMPATRRSAVITTIDRPSRVRTRKAFGCMPNSFCGGPFSTITCQETSFQTPMRPSASAANRGLEMARKTSKSAHQLILRTLSHISQERSSRQMSLSEPGAWLGVL
jgi:hypothetical protein